MNRTEVTYGQLDKVLRSLGFSCRPTKQVPPGRIYEHKITGAVVMLPELLETDQVLEHHLVAAQMEVSNFGLANPSVFAAKLENAG
jgi:hypothetical protein